MAKKITIAQLRHRVHLCSQQDVVVDGNLSLNRKGILSMWAKIDVKAASEFSPNGAAMDKNRERRTHVICIRYHRDFDVSTMGWIYEERRKSAPRWFKILKVNQTEMAGTEYFMFDARLVEKSATVPVPDALDEPALDAGPVQPMPLGVVL